MALLRCDFFSEVLSLDTSMTVILPEPTSAQAGPTGRPAAEPPAVLYLLHGLSDDDSSWVRQTSIERYVDDIAAPLAVVMPQVHRSYYTDEAYGGRYWTHLSEELPALVGLFFRVSERRDDTFVAGLSMGGYGALKWALRQPERFAAAASLSGALDVAGPRWRRTRPEDPRMAQRIFGDQSVAGSEDDLMALAETADPALLPALGVWCGGEDHLLSANQRFADTCAAAGVPVELTVTAGDHEWGYWDATIQQVLAWLPLGARRAGISTST